MSGTDAFVDSAVAPSLDLAVRKEIQRLRKLLRNPNEVHLVTRPRHDENPVSSKVSFERWITDRYVMVNVTGSLALDRPDAIAQCGDIFPQWPDGGYKLMASKGFVPREDAFLPDTVGLLDSIERDGEWQRMYRTQWSMADSDAKLMLAYTIGDRAYFHVADALAVNEEIWVAFEETFPESDVFFEACEDRPYRVTAGDGKVVGYIAKARFPDEKMREDALGVAEVVAER